MTIIVSLDSIFLTHIAHVIIKSLTLVALFRVVSFCHLARAQIAHYPIFHYYFHWLGIFAINDWP